MIIIDAQVHIWPPQTPERPYIMEDASKPHRPVPLGPEELLHEMEIAGVQRVICVPPSWEGCRNDFALEVDHLDRRAAICFSMAAKAPLIGIFDF